MLIGQTTGAVKTQVQTGTVKKQEGDLSRDKVETGSSGCGFVDQMSKLKEIASNRCCCGDKSTIEEEGHSTEGSINDNFAQYPNAVVENPGTGEVRPLGEHVLSEKLKKINNPATPIDEAISLWTSYKKDAEAYLINPVSFGRDFSDFSYVKTNDSNLQVVGFPKPESLSGSMIEWTNYIQEKNPDGTISLTPLQPEQMEEGSFNLEHYTDGHIFPDGGLELKFTSQASSILITEGTNMFVKVDGEWVKNPAGKI